MFDSFIMSWIHHSTGLDGLKLIGLTGSLDLVRVRLTEQLFVVAGRIVIVEGNGAGSL